MKLGLPAAALLASVLALPASANADGSDPTIPFEKYALANGMTVILAPDAKVPMVTLNVMVKVGSRFEAPKRTGFAHLFEHLMFMGTTRVPTGAFDQWMEREGGYNNAWTSEDRTNYFDVAPSHVLPLLLWLEADRFGSLADSMTKEKLDAQRKVVRNERRQTSENEPYGKAELRLPELLYPPEHPYHHPVIGSHEDLEAASVDDVKGFFKTHYVPSNLSLVIAGDFDKATARDLVQKSFAGLGGTAAPAPAAPAAPRLDRVVRETIEDKVELPKIIMAWHSPARFAPGDAELDLLSNVLVDGKSSVLYKSLVFDKQLAQSVQASQVSQDLSSYFVIEILARPKVSLDEIERAVDAEIAKLAKTPVSKEQLERAKNDFETAFVKRLESVHSRASMLNAYQTYVGDPGFIGKDLARYRSASEASILGVAKDTFDPNRRVVLRIVPKKAEAAPAPAKTEKK